MFVDVAGYVADAEQPDGGTQSFNPATNSRPLSRACRVAATTVRISTASTATGLSAKKYFPASSLWFSEDPLSKSGQAVLRVPVLLCNQIAIWDDQSAKEYFTRNSSFRQVLGFGSVIPWSRSRNVQLRPRA
jgi:hypothetical protein